jgi:superfamily I DNA/RNA helicase
MNGDIQLAPVDRLLVDEFQDMSGLALDIIDSIPAEQKIFVGDDNQAVFTFLKLQNGFAKYPDAKQLHLTKSFRVDQKYAPAIQGFLRSHLESDAVFQGMNYPPNPVITTRAYLTRTNSTLISKMIELNKSGTPYHLSSKAKLKQMFKLPLALIYAKPAHDQKDTELKHLQHDIDDWGSLSASKRKDLNLFQYLRKINPDDNKLINAMNLILQYSSNDIIEAYEHANDHKSKPCNLTLMTVHTAKGSTLDSVELADDVNEAVSEILKKDQSKLTEDDLAEYRLYFVACTRHRYQLINATHLNLWGVS